MLLGVLLSCNVNSITPLRLQNVTRGGVIVCYKPLKKVPLSMKKSALVRIGPPADQSKRVGYTKLTSLFISLTLIFIRHTPRGLSEVTLQSSHRSNGVIAHGHLVQAAGQPQAHQWFSVTLEDWKGIFPPKQSLSPN